MRLITEGDCTTETGDVWTGPMRETEVEGRKVSKSDEEEQSVLLLVWYMHEDGQDEEVQE